MSVAVSHDLHKGENHVSVDYIFLQSIVIYYDSCYQLHSANLIQDCPDALEELLDLLPLEATYMPQFQVGRANIRAKL
ncbi:hypothetical protein C8R43DRAFT_1116420 [Mycena crocata]|nr:hypothetical protein C8R43DRAFT_1116420 [Mycena crocata]